MRFNSTAKRDTPNVVATGVLMGLLTLTLLPLALLSLGCSEPIPAGDVSSSTDAADTTAADTIAADTIAVDTTAADTLTIQCQPGQTACDDGDSCTVEDHCSQGACIGGISICECKTTADCATKEDGNACNGTLYCDTATKPYACRVNPATVIYCQTGADTPCRTTSCDPASGVCSASTFAGNPCDDGDACTNGDTCDAKGACIPGTSICACTVSSDCAPLNSPNLCDGTYYCDVTATPRRCVINPATVVTCATTQDKPCRKNLCDPKTKTCNLTDLPDNKLCQDGNGCTQNDRCKAGSCEPGVDTCPCKGDADCAAKEDGNLCNGTLFCDLVDSSCKLNPKTVVTCPTAGNTACMKTVCQSKTGECKALAVAEGLPCDDGKVCTTSEKCTAGKCAGGTDLCICTNNSDCQKKDDDNLCNGSMYCDLSAGTPTCRTNPATVVTCPTGSATACTRNVCQAKTGTCKLIPRTDGTTCDADGNTCTLTDVCIAGTCTAGVNTCECQSDKDCGAKEDGDYCNGTLYCNKTLNKPACQLNMASKITCPTVDNGPCVTSSCVPQSGKCALLPHVDGSLCDDGKKCTLSDACKGGGCRGENKSCDDGDGCTYDACTFATGACTHKALPCNDGNACTKDECQPSNGKCIGLPTAATCSDGDVCTAGDGCKGGACLGGNVLSCDDGKPCTLDTCKSGVGCTHVVLVAGTCDDGDGCTVGESCSAQGCRGGKARDCGDDNPCTIDSCKKAKGCVYISRDAGCNDGNPCTADGCDVKTGLCRNTPNGSCDRAGCGSSKDCKKGYCDPVTWTCSDCLNHSQCGNGEVCQAGICVAGVVCKSTVACKARGQVCDVKAGMCADCIGDVDCGSSEVCVARTCIERKGCKTDKQCAYVCAKSLGYCVACVGDVDCLKGGWCGGDHRCHPPVCTQDGCAGGGGERLVCRANGSGFTKVACDDGNACTDDGCAAGKCASVVVKDLAGVGKVACDDQNACTVDVCGAAGTCAHSAVKDGTFCGQGSCRQGSCRGVVDFDVGDQHVCALTKSGKAWCWGWNFYGQLGNGTSIDEAAPVLVSGSHTFVNISVSYRNTCATDSSGLGWCWGGNTDGQLGIGAIGNSVSKPRRFSVSKKLVAFATSIGFSCAVDVSGGVWCSGSNDVGQLGANLPYKKKGSTYLPYKSSVPVQVLKLGSAVMVRAGRRHVCALTTGKKVMCWGTGQYGELGDGTLGLNYKRSVPVAVNGLSDVIDLSVAGLTSCALRANGSVWCWGRLGSTYTGTLSKSFSTPIPMKVAAVKNFSAFTTSSQMLCGVQGTGDVVCWGQRNGIVPGRVYGGEVVTPQTVAGLKDVVRLASAPDSSTACSLDSHGVLKCWGLNGRGQLGRGVFGDILHDKPGVPAIDSGAKDLWLNGFSACATDAKGRLLCWGNNNNFGFGDGVVGGQATPVVVAGMDNVVSYAASWSHACSVKLDGTMWCWGRNDKGQLMQNTTSDKLTLTPVKAQLSNKAVRVDIEERKTCVTFSIGGTKCVGLGSSGTPTHSCGLGGGFVSCRGVLTRGAVGGGRPRHCPGNWKSYPSTYPYCIGCEIDYKTRLCFKSSRSTRVDSTDMKDVKSLCVGADHSCAVDGAGAVWCWGAGTEGQLGDGAKSDKFVPSKVHTYTRKAISIHCAGNTTCALDSQGGVTCWGDNSYGQIGDGSAWSLIPKAPLNLP